MDLTREFVRAKNPCAEGYRWFLRHFEVGGNYQELLDALVNAGRVDDACWLLSQFGPTHTRLVLDDLNAEAMVFSGSLEIRGNVEMGALLRVGRNLHIGGSARIDGALFAGDDIRVEGQLRCQGTLEAGGDIRTGWGIDSEADILCGGDLRVGWGLRTQGKLSVTNDVRVSQDLVVAGKIACGKNLRVGGSIATDDTLQIGQGILAGGSISCATHLNANFGVKAGKDITVGGAIRVGESLMATGQIAAGQGYGVFAGLNVHVDAWFDSGKVCASARPEFLISGLCETYRKAANRIYAHTVNQMRSKWITAMSPIVGQTFRIRAKVVPLRSRNALLVTQISGVQFSTQVASLSYSIAKREIPVGMPAQGQEVKPPVESVAVGKPASVSKPVDRSPTKRYFQLPSMSVKFPGLPVPKRFAREERMIPLPVSGPSQVTQVPRSVSVGTPGSRPAPSGGQFTPEEERRIEDGFQEILELVEELMANNKIDDVKEYPLVRPVPEGAPSYCEFPYSDDVKPWPWSMVRGPLRRPRLALVLELSVGERLIYWIETETSKDENYCSLAVEMADGSSLDEGVLETLLDICSEAKGIWPDPLPFGEGSIFSVRARHSRVDGKLTWNVMLLAFARLEHARVMVIANSAVGLEQELVQS